MYIYLFAIYIRNCTAAISWSNRVLELSLSLNAAIRTLFCQYPLPLSYVLSSQVSNQQTCSIAQTLPSTVFYSFSLQFYSPFLNRPIMIQLMIETISEALKTESFARYNPLKFYRTARVVVAMFWSLKVRSVFHFAIVSFGFMISREIWGSKIFSRV